MRSKTLLAAVGLLALFSIAAGCSDKTEQAAETAVQGAAQDTAANVEKAGEATAEAGKEVAEGAEKAAEATGEAVSEAGQAVAEGTEKAAEHVGEAVGGAAKEAADAGQVVTLTPTVKNALVADKQINASTINVDTSGEKDTVVIKGTVPSEAAKKRATEVATKALKDAGSNFKVKNELTVGK